MTQAPADGMSPSTMTRETYRFPSDRLRGQLKEPGKTPLVLVACGSCKFLAPRRGANAEHLPLIVAQQLGVMGTDYGGLGPRAQSRRLRFCT